jgi:hypothetical protein
MLERLVGNDDCVKFERMSLRIPADRHRCNRVKAKVLVHRYPEDPLALLHVPCKLACFTPDGKPIDTASSQAA